MKGQTLLAVGYEPANVGVGSFEGETQREAWLRSVSEVEKGSEKAARARALGRLVFVNEESVVGGAGRCGQKGGVEGSRERLAGACNLEI